MGFIFVFLKDNITYAMFQETLTNKCQESLLKFEKIDHKVSSKYIHIQFISHIHYRSKTIILAV